MGQVSKIGMHDLAPEGEISRAIVYARILAIFFMSYVHAWPGATVVSAAALEPPLSWVTFVLIDELGRGAVPLLSIVSGVLAYRTFARGRTPQILGRKVASLLVPMTFWNIAMLAMLGAGVLVGFAPAGLPETALGWVNAVLALTAAPANTPLAFLRDVFVCMLLAPVVLAALDRSPWRGIGLIAALAVIAYLSVPMPFLRPSIFLFFGLGLVLAHQGGLVRAAHPGVAAAALAALGLYDLMLAGTGVLGPEVENILRRVLIAAIFWQVCITLARRFGDAAALKLEPYVFLFFCSHLILFRLAGIGIERAIGTVGDPLFWLAYLVQPVLGFVAVVVLYRIGQKVAPRLLALSLGARAAYRPGPALPAGRP